MLWDNIAPQLLKQGASPQILPLGLHLAERWGRCEGEGEGEKIPPHFSSNEQSQPTTVTSITVQSVVVALHNSIQPLALNLGCEASILLLTNGDASFGPGLEFLGNHTRTRRPSPLTLSSSVNDYDYSLISGTSCQGVLVVHRCQQLRLACNLFRISPNATLLRLYHWLLCLPPPPTPHAPKKKKSWLMLLKHVENEQNTLSFCWWLQWRIAHSWVV